MYVSFAPIHVDKPTTCCIFLLFFSYGKDPSCLDTEEKEADLVDMINDAVQVRDDYHESATMALSLTKPRGGKKQKDQKDWFFLSALLIYSDPFNFTI